MIYPYVLTSHVHAAPVTLHSYIFPRMARYSFWVKTVLALAVDSQASCLI